ncbi:hypothetical protein [Caulobacter phage Cr30]|uniref:hypothetical protein n=1 Tax=Caulobacter phage Cr30 TaxID=1357714 RepID=UPI0004A9B439|nr:hypothetical protein OZ74_gp044 [Caulobacter phage Cr30]AGS80929.1 hypothetical protein [Caulobacter phage Cr30]
MMIKQYKIITASINDLGNFERNLNQFVLKGYHFHDLKVSTTSDFTRLTAILFKEVSHPDEV